MPVGRDKIGKAAAGGKARNISREEGLDNCVWAGRGGNSSTVNIHVHVTRYSLGTRCVYGDLN